MKKIQITNTSKKPPEDEVSDMKSNPENANLTQQSHDYNSGSNPGQIQSNILTVNLQNSNIQPSQNPEFQLNQTNFAVQPYQNNQIPPANVPAIGTDPNASSQFFDQISQPLQQIAEHVKALSEQNPSVQKWSDDLSQFDQNLMAQNQILFGQPLPVSLPQQVIGANNQQMGVQLNQNRPSQFAHQNANTGLIQQNLNVLVGGMQNQGTPSHSNQHAHSEGYLETSPQTLIQIPALNQGQQNEQFQEFKIPIVPANHPSQLLIQQQNQNQQNQHLQGGQIQKQSQQQQINQQTMMNNQQQQPGSNPGGIGAQAPQVPLNHQMNQFNNQNQIPNLQGAQQHHGMVQFQQMQQQPPQSQTNQVGQNSQQSQPQQVNVPQQPPQNDGFNMQPVKQTSQIQPQVGQNQIQMFQQPQNLNRPPQHFNGPQFQQQHQQMVSNNQVANPQGQNLIQQQAPQASGVQQQNNVSVPIQVMPPPLNPQIPSFNEQLSAGSNHEASASAAAAETIGLLHSIGQLLDKQNQQKQAQSQQFQPQPQAQVQANDQKAAKNQQQPPVQQPMQNSGQQTQQIFQQQQLVGQNNIQQQIKQPTGHQKLQQQFQPGVQPAQQPQFQTPAQVQQQILSQQSSIQNIQGGQPQQMQQLSQKMPMEHQQFQFDSNNQNQQQQQQILHQSAQVLQGQQHQIQSNDVSQQLQQQQQPIVHNGMQQQMNLQGANMIQGDQAQMIQTLQNQVNQLVGNNSNLQNQQHKQQTAQQLSQLIGLLGQLQNQITNTSSQAQQPTNDFQLRRSKITSDKKEVFSKKYPVYIKFFIGGILYSTKEPDIHNYFKKVAELIDVAVMRDKNSGRSRGFAFVTFVVYPTMKEVDDFGTDSDFSQAQSVRELNQKMMKPTKPHQIQNRAVEIRQSDGGKPQDSFIVKRNQQLQQKESRRNDQDRDRSRDRGHRRGDREKRGERDKRSPSRNKQRRNRRSRSRSRSRSRDSNRSQDKRSFQAWNEQEQQSRSSNEVDQNRAQKSYSQNNFGRSDSEGSSRNQQKNRMEDRVGSQGADRQSMSAFDRKRHDRELNKLNREHNKSIRDKVFVGGLDYGLTDQNFKRHFAQFGEIKECQIIRDPLTKSSRGFGFIRYFDDSVAQKLITETQITMIGGRRVDMRTADLKVPDRIAQINRQVQNETKMDRQQNSMEHHQPSAHQKQYSSTDRAISQHGHSETIQLAQVQKSLMIPPPQLNPAVAHLNQAQQIPQYGMSQKDQVGLDPPLKPMDQNSE